MVYVLGIFRTLYFILLDSFYSKICICTRLLSLLFIEAPPRVTLAAAEGEGRLWGLSNSTKATGKAGDICSADGIETIVARTALSAVVSVVIGVSVARDALAISAFRASLCRVLVEGTLLACWPLLGMVVACSLLTSP